MEEPFVWIITAFINQNVKMYEFNTEEEAREAFIDIKGYKILSEILYYNDPSLQKLTLV
jgi:hypothetical protein